MVWCGVVWCGGDVVVVGMRCDDRMLADTKDQRQM